MLEKLLRARDLQLPEKEIKGRFKDGFRGNDWVVPGTIHWNPHVSAICYGLWENVVGRSSEVGGLI